MRRLWLPILIAVALAVAVGVPIWFGFAGPRHYGGSYLWPGLVGNFTASFFAFVLALSWDRQVKSEEATKAQKEFTRRQGEEREEFERRQAKEEEAEEDRLKTEARRLLELVLVELEHDRKVIAALAPATVEHAGLAYHIRTGAWASSADILGRLLSKSDLVAKTSGLYDRLSELEYRLRFVAERTAVASQLQVPDSLKRSINETDLLVRGINDDFDKILEDLRQEANDPAVDRLGIRREIALDFIQSTTTVFPIGES